MTFENNNLFDIKQLIRINKYDQYQHIKEFIKYLLASGVLERDIKYKSRYHLSEEGLRLVYDLQAQFNKISKMSIF
jgi:predicted transcriptional regulator